MLIVAENGANRELSRHLRPGHARAGDDELMPFLRTASSAVRRAVPGLVLVLSLAACGSSEDPEPSGLLPPRAAPSLPSVADGVSQEGVPQLVNLLVQDGRVQGVGATVDVRLNSRVRLTVIADTADVLLVRDYGIRAPLAVDQPTQVEFLASRQGDAEVVLEQSGQVLTTLVVS